ncbi:MAG: magnesium/cobalt transporter CorA [bacterium]|nr:magnesium/cobalt transporter CorA [bacterium]
MLTLVRKRSEKSGLPPGSVIHVGEKKVEKTGFTLIRYDAEKFSMEKIDSLEECLRLKGSEGVTWINVDGLHETDVIEKLGERFGIHLLIVEDILNTQQRSKADIFDDYIYVAIKMHSSVAETMEISVEQLSLVLGADFVLTFQEQPGDIFDALRKRIEGGKGKVRRMGADYLAYCLIDAVVDNYFKILESVGEEIEDIEEELLENPSPETVQHIHIIKREMILLRKSVWPLRDLIGLLNREETDLIKEGTEIYLRDVYDHTVQVIDTVETYRDMIAGMLDIYLSSVSYRMNEIMKVLTIFAAIFIPLTFIVGLYGMNFDPDSGPFNMPELRWRYGYPAVLAFMALIVVGMGFYFKRKKWF